MSKIPEPTENIEFILNFDKIKDSNKLPGYIRLLAYKVKSDGYVTTGDFFKSLNNDDLSNLGDAVELTNSNNLLNFTKTEAEQSEKSKEIALIAIMLLHGEGAITPTYQDIHKAMEAVSTLTLLELAFRSSDEIEIIRENYSVTETNRDVARPKKT